MLRASSLHTRSSRSVATPQASHIPIPRLQDTFSTASSAIQKRSLFASAGFTTYGIAAKTAPCFTQHVRGLKRRAGKAARDLLKAEGDVNMDALSEKDLEIVQALAELDETERKLTSGEYFMETEETQPAEETEEAGEEEGEEKEEEEEEGVEKQREGALEDTAEFLIDGKPIPDDEGDFEFPMPYYANYKTGKREKAEKLDLDTLTNETQDASDNAAVLFAEAATLGHVNLLDFFKTVPVDEIWTALRNMDGDALLDLKDDFMYHVMPDLLFLDDADFLLPDPNPKLWGPETYDEDPDTARLTDLIWHMADQEEDPLHKRKEEAVADFRANFVPNAVAKRIWELHKSDQRFWSYDRLARTFSVKRAVVKGICYLREEEEADERGLPFDSRKNLRMFKWERKAEAAATRRAFETKNVSQEEAYRQYIEAMSKPEDYGLDEFIPLFQGALDNPNKKAQEEIKKLRDVSSKAGLGTVVPRSKFVFVEVGRHVNDKNRRWIVRDMDGTLRTASIAERDLLTNGQRSRAFGRGKYH